MKEVTYDDFGMSYQALLFSADERASGVVKQVLGELEFHVEVCNEPFAAVKQITNQRYDALVVDCDNEQNATLLFKSARNSNSNKDSLAVGLVQGQGSIAKAFRIGANLVLTKPIHAEQSKATLRTARGLLRKAEAAKSAAATALTSGSEESALSAVAAFSAVPELSVGPVATASLEQQADEFPKPDPAEAAFLESMPIPVSRQLSERSAVSQESKTQAPAGTTRELISAQATAGGAAAAAAPAKIPTPAAVETTTKEKRSPAAKEIATPVDKKTAAESKPVAQAAFAETAIQSGSLQADLLAAANPAEETPSKKNFLIALVLVLGSAGAIYYSWPQLQPLLVNIPIVEKYLGSQPAPPAASLAPRPATPVQPAAGAQTQTESPGETSPSPAQPNQATANQSSTNQPAPAQAAANATTSAGKTSGNAPDGRNAAPLRLDAQTAAGLLVQKVDPVYPPSALQEHLEGSVKLQADVAKDGSTSNIKSLSGKPALATAAAAAVGQWKYKPYLVNGVPTAFQTEITVDFKLP